MISDQNFLFALLLFVFVFLIWGRWRYDLVAFAALCIALIWGVVPKDAAFSGFGHPATVIIALVLIVSRALSNSGAIELLARYVVDASRALGAHIGIMSALAAGLSAVMNNVAALALLMPIDIQAAKKAKRSPALTLMPISFASILGGMITLIGTPPNIVIAEFRGTVPGLEQSYSMFDFAPVGIVCALVGVLFIALIGWRLIPGARSEHDSGKELFDLKNYIAELSVSEESKAIGKAIRELDDIADDNEASIIGLIRDGQRMPGMSRRVVIREDDLLVVEAAPDALDKLAGALKLEITSSDMAKAMLDGADDITMIEVVVPEGALIEGRSALTLGLLYRHGVSLLGVSRQGQRFSERVRRLKIEAGDVLLLLGPSERLGEISSWMGALAACRTRPAGDPAGKSRACGRRVRRGRTGGKLRASLSADRARRCRGLDGAPQYRPAPPDLQFDRMAGDRAPRLDDPDRLRSRSKRRHGADRGLDRHARRRLRALGRAHASGGGHDDALRCHEQHGDRRDRRPDRRRHRHPAERQSRSLPDGCRRRCKLRFPHADRPQEQHADHGPRRLPLRRLLAHGPAARSADHRDRRTDDPLRLATLDGVTTSLGFGCLRRKSLGFRGYAGSCRMWAGSWSFWLLHWFAIQGHRNLSEACWFAVRVILSMMIRYQG